MVTRGDLIDELALALSQRPEVPDLVLLLQLFQHFAPFHRFDQRLALLLRLALGVQNLFLLGIDFALKPLQIVLEEEHVGAAEALPLMATLGLDALPSRAFPISEIRLRGGQRPPGVGKLLLEAFLGVTASNEQGFEAKLEHGDANGSRGALHQRLLKPGYGMAAGRAEKGRRPAAGGLIPLFRTASPVAPPRPPAAPIH